MLAEHLVSTAPGDVNVGQTWVDLAVVAQGMAWLFVKYSKDPAIRTAETKARDAWLGLWQDESTVAPWEWRNSRKDHARR